VHQHCHVGRLSIMRGMARATVDVPPFAIFDGTSTVRGLNRVGLQRAGFDGARIAALAKAFRILFRVRVNLRMAMARVEAEVSSPDVEYLLAFLRSARRGGAAGPPARHRPDRDDAD
jgi:UDP-N-acetylglucosamine acyltransferase